MKLSFYGYRADIFGLFWLATALFLGLALASYNPLDPSFNSIGSSLEVQNKCGYLGSFLSDLLYQLFGWGAWVFVIISFNNSVIAFQRRMVSESVWKHAFLMMGSVFTASSLFELHQPGKELFQGHISSGGLLGHFVIENASPYLHFAGLFLFLWSLILILFVLYTRRSLATIFMRNFKALKILLYYIGVRLPYWFGQVFHWSKNVAMFIWLKPKGISPQKKDMDMEGDPLSEGEKEVSLFFDEEKDSSENFENALNQDSSLSLQSPLSAKGWNLPSTRLLSAPAMRFLKLDKKEKEEEQENAERLINKLSQFSIMGEITDIHSGPVITLFEFKPEDHIKVARITQMEDDLMIALKSESIRIIAPIPGRDVVGIETAHKNRQKVYLKTLLEESSLWKKDLKLPLVLGRTVDGQPAIMDLQSVPHLMVAGSTGSGKSVFIISFILSLLFRYSPKQLRFLIIDPKRVDLSIFENLPHLLSPPIQDSKSTVLALKWCLSEMQKRYHSISRFQVRDLESFNEKVKKLKRKEIEEYQRINETKEDNYYFSHQPYICVILEEFGDLMSSPEKMQIENSVVRLAQMARACGIHLILSMQSPRKDIVTGLIKTNISGRISFKVSSRIDSRIILGEGGAERLLSKGDMLYLGSGQARPERYHAPFVKEKEVENVVKFWEAQAKGISSPSLFDLEKRESFDLFNTSFSDQEDQKYKEIFDYVSQLKQVSASLLQRKYGLGYPRAARLIDRFEAEGLVGPAKGSKPREVLLSSSGAALKR